MAKKRRKRKKTGQGQMILLLSLVGMIMVSCLLYAVYRKSSGESGMTNQEEATQGTGQVETGTLDKQEDSADTNDSANAGDTNSVSDNNVAAAADSAGGQIADTQDNETPADAPNVETNADASGQQLPEVSPQASMNADGATWTSFDGHTLGNCESTYGSIYTKQQIVELDGTKQGYGQGVNVDDKNRPTGATMLQDKYDKYGAIFIAEDSMNIYMTLDEGYENGYTNKILDAMKASNCRGVFFVTLDYVKKNMDLVQRMIDEGHVIGNHSVSHKSMPTLSLEEQSSEITELHNYVKEQFGYDMYLFRPPMGEFSEQTLALCQSLGYRVTLWSYAYKDYDTENQPDQGEAFQKVTAAKHGGAVYLLHAVSATNCAIMQDVVNDFRAKGYEVGPIPR